MKILIVGANFSNKGAQSMLFITTDELIKRFPRAEIYYATNEKYDEELYKFKKVYYSRSCISKAFNEKATVNDKIKLIKSLRKESKVVQTKKQPKTIR